MFKKILFIITGFCALFYALFLILPFILTPIVNNYSSNILNDIKKDTGFIITIDGLKVVSTPKFTFGLKFEKLNIKQPDEKNLADATNFQVKMSLLPILLKKIRIDYVACDDINVNLFVKKDGKFLIEDFFIDKQNNDDNKEKETMQEEPFELPFGFKLSNHLPDFTVKKHNISFIDTNNKIYSFEGNNTRITDFVFNKKIKLSSEGYLNLDGFKAFNYNFKIKNYLMPELDLNETIALQAEEKAEKDKKNAEININIIDIFKSLKNNAVTADLLVDAAIHGTFNEPEITGNANASKISMLVGDKKLPESTLSVIFNKNKYTIDSSLNTSENENTKINGYIKSGKSPKIDLNCKSNATLTSIFKIAHTIASSFGLNDLKTLSGQGNLDIDFNLKSDFKSVNSSGFIKLTSGLINYALYGVKIENLISDIKLDNNSVNINKLGFSTLGIPFLVTGKIASDAKCDIKVQTSKLPIKGLLVSLGQASILKDNPIKSGTITVLANISDKLDSPKITGDVQVNNLNLKNIPSDVNLTVHPVSIKLKSTKSGFDGTITAYDLKAVNPAIVVSIPNIDAKINEKNIVFSESKVMAGKNQLGLLGELNDYMTEKIGVNFKTTGAISSALTGSVNPAKMLLDLKYATINSSSLIIPGFDKSKLSFTGYTTITGNMANPILKGQFSVPSLEIPEVPVTMKGIQANLNGPILNGDATVSDFTSGGIVASNIKTDYKSLGNMFYLKNLTGKAFEGNFKGDIAYNINSSAASVKFDGDSMNALKAIEGAAGIKNALSGTLSFKTDIAFKGTDYNDMMKTLKGSADFEIKNGVLANLGNLNSLLYAQNIANSTIFKSSDKKLSGAASAQSATKFDYIKGAMTFASGYANIKSIKSSGPSVAYYVVGKYNLLNAYTSVDVLGRLSQDIVGGLGTLGDFAASKLSAIHPIFGQITSNIVASMTVSPDGLKVSEIPSLSSKSEYKDFKVVFNGNIENPNSVKSFKWINKPVTETPSTTEVQVPTSVDDAKEKAVQAANQLLNKAVSTSKPANSTANSNNTNTNQTQKTSKEILKDTAKEQGKALLKSLITTPVDTQE